MELYDPKQKSCQTRYHLLCKVVVKDCTYEDQQSTGNSIISEKLVFLIPEYNDQATRFFNAWMPETLEGYQEIGCEMGHPLYSAFRAALYRVSTFNSSLRENHIFVMSKGAEEILKRLDNQMVNVEILGEQEEALLDGMIDHELTLNKNLGKFVPKSINLSGEE